MFEEKTRWTFVRIFSSKFSSTLLKWRCRFIDDAAEKKEHRETEEKRESASYSSTRKVAHVVGY